MSVLIIPKKQLWLWYKEIISSRILLGDTAILVYLALVKLVIHLATSNNYGFFRDELYFIAAGQHLDLGYVDFPAFIALAAAFTHFVFGDSLVAFHILPAVAGMFVVLLTGLIARELGGGRFAQCLASLASLVSPIFLGMDSLFTMNAFDELWWVLASYILVLVIKRERPRLWLLFGLVAGIGLLTKLTMLMFGFALVVGLLFSSKRKYLLDKRLWLGGGDRLCLPLCLYSLGNAPWVALYRILERLSLKPGTGHSLRIPLSTDFAHKSTLSSHLAGRIILLFFRARGKALQVVWHCLYHPLRHVYAQPC